MTQSSTNAVLDGLPGWAVENSKYGKWFISRDAVIVNWKQDQAKAYPDKPVKEPCDAVIEVWFNEQITWIEVSAYGKQLERPNMGAVEAAWLREMAGNSDWVALD